MIRYNFTWSEFGEFMLWALIVTTLMTITLIIIHKVITQKDKDDK